MSEKNKHTQTTNVYKRNELKEAAMALRIGELVAFPTETVFGLGAIANNESAVRKVFEIKGRPVDNPLIVHVHNIESVANYVLEINEIEKRLMQAFWPGPLTIIFPLKENVFAPSVTPNMTTVGIRMPKQLETLLLIEMVGFPLVGPSANLSGKPSPTTVKHVLHDFDGKIKGVVDNYGQLTDIGIESTVVKVDKDVIYILRPGAITKEMIEKVTSTPVIERTSTKQLEEPDLMSPGVKYRHYSPKQPVITVKPTSDIDQWREIIKADPRPKGILAQNHILTNFNKEGQVISTYSLGEEGDFSQATKHLFSGLRYLEETACEVIYVQSFEDTPETHAYLNRLSKASSSML